MTLEYLNGTCLMMLRKHCKRLGLRVHQRDGKRLTAVDLRQQLRELSKAEAIKRGKE